MSHGGQRKGAGRKKITESEQRKPVKVYLTPQQIEDIHNLGVGATLSAKAAELIESSLNYRKEHKYTFIDLFCGIGGFRLALEQQGLECVFSSEIDSNCHKVYEANFEEVPSGDITRIKPKRLPDFDVLVAGFPCQSFSTLGLRKGTADKRGKLIYNIIDILKAKQPKMFLLENVSAIKSIDNGSTYSDIINELRSAGYCVYDMVLDSKDFGLAQSRKRWYCVGFDNNRYFEFPTSSEPNKTLRDIVDINLMDDTLALSIREKEMIQNHFKLANKTSAHLVQHDVAKLYPSCRPKWLELGLYSKLSNNVLRFHLGQRIPLLEYTYVSLDTITQTLTTTRAPKLWDLQRQLTLTELKRLQGFSDDFSMPVTPKTALKQLGNTVSVPVIEAIIKNMVYYYNQP